MPLQRHRLARPYIAKAAFLWYTIAKYVCSVYASSRGGREYEKRKLARCLEMEQAQLVLVYGRRRVGKTYLIHQFFNGSFIVFSGEVLTTDRNL